MPEPSPEPTLETLIAEHAPFMERLGRALVGDPHRAADLIQETWAAALRRPDILEGIARDGGSVRGWLATVLRRRSASSVRRLHRGAETRLPEGGGEEAPEDGPGPSEVALRLERQALVQDALRKLEGPYQEVLVLRFQDGLSAAEIARRTGQPASTVRSQVARGLEELRAVLDRSHRGGRAEWLAAVAPLAFPRLGAAPLLPAASTAASTAALSAVSSPLSVLAMKKLAFAAAALLVIAVLVQAPWRPVSAPDATHSFSGAGVAGPVEAEALGSPDAGEVALEPAVPLGPVEDRAREVAPGSAAAGESENAHAPSEPANSAASMASKPGATISGRVVLLDGTPVPDAYVRAAIGNRGIADATTNERGEFEFVGMPAEEVSLSVDSRAEIPSAQVDGLFAPRAGVELRLDALIFRVRVPDDINVDPDVGGSDSLLAFGADDAPFHTTHRGGFQPVAGATLQDILPTGPGYAMLVSRGNEYYSAILDPGLASGIYERELQADSPELAAIEVVLSGASLVAPGRMSVYVEREEQGTFRSYPVFTSFAEGVRRARAGTLMPGRYRLKGSVIGPPPRSWIYPVLKTIEIELEAGDEALVEVELREGGGLALEIEASPGETKAIFEVWERKDSTETWGHHGTYVPVGEGYRVSRRIKAGVLYRSESPVEPGATEFRVTGKGYVTVEETLHLRAGELTEWRPVMEKAVE